MGTARRVLLRADRAADALVEARTAAALNPLDYFSHFEVWATMYFARRYDEAFCTLPVVTPWQHPDGDSAWHLYVLRVRPAAGRTHAEVFAALRAAGIRVNLHYLPVYRHPYYARWHYDPTEFPEAERKKEVAEAAWQQVTESFDVLEAALAKAEWLAGPAFSVGDLNVAAALYRALAIDTKRWPRTQAWLHRCWERPAAKRARAMHRVVTLSQNQIAGAFGFKQAESFQIEVEAQREAPRVSF